MDLKEEFMSAPIDIYNGNQASINWAHRMTTKGLRYLHIRKTSVREAGQTKFLPVKHVSDKVKFSDIITKEHKYKAHYIILWDHLMSKLAIMGKVRRCIHICENISAIPTYGDICHQNSPPKQISDIDSMYNDSYKMISVV